MIVFNNWTLTVTGLIARQYDNLSRRIDVEGDLPAGYTWQLLVQSGGNADTILLEATETGAGAVLTADNLSRAGEYYIQLRGVLEADGVTRRHTNVVNAYIPESLTGLGTWPEVPTEFAQVEARILELYRHPPVPGSNGCWLVWDTDKDEYVESQLSLPDVSVGPPGPAGFSPTVSLTETAEGVRIDVTDQEGTESATIKNGQDGAPGKDGAPGADGAPGKDGSDGKDGVTPTIGDNGNWYLGDTDTGNPSQGKAGPGVPTGGTAGQVLTKIGDSDYAAEWKDAPADGNVDLDTTLTVEGKAADAKAVGDALSALSEEIANLGGGTGGCYLTVETLTIGEGTGETVAVTGITLDYSTISLNEGESMMLEASVAPSDATNSTVLWKSSDTSVATVDNGLVTAVSSGNATITAYSQENSSIEATCAVTVVAASGGDTPGKIMFADMTPVKTGVVLKKDATTEYASSAAHGYYKLPYSDGMQISTVMNMSWVSNYPPVIVVDSAVTIPEYTDNGYASSSGKVYSTTLSGFSDMAEIYVNVSFLSGDDINLYCYYIPGGAE